ncbi:MAG: NADH-quinone oxidoreductase subunit C [Oxalobacter sp.]|nr:MAG: NADH-quinone oxidoreductase subunit C [Oxalobacter sp.]
MTAKLDTLADALRQTLGDAARELKISLGEVTLTVDDVKYLDVMRKLRDTDVLAFDQLVDLCGVDYSQYGDGAEGQWQGGRYAVVSHLLSLTHNWRLRVRVFASDDAQPAVASVIGVWPSANWYEREAFDLYGIHFDGHDDLRRILTDYGFVGHPFRKDFPTSGHVEMRYDEAQKRVVYQPVTVEPREVTPRVIREPNFGVKG